ncbi:trichohyalin-like [Macrobrachium rosenbergii]|uniref:trichohyalin-like n=1 Tax=Macrobrachium rosenbergii TaxID=79674 RepID=UPI0034D500DD
MAEVGGYRLQTQKHLSSTGVNSGLQVLDTFAAAVDSLEPEIIQQPDSLSAPDFAVAKPGLALLAGLALAVFWKYKFYGLKYYELEECMESELRDCEDQIESHMSASEDDFETDITDSEDDLGLDMSESESDLEMDMSDSENDFEAEMSDDDDDSETEMSLVSRLEDSLELEDSENDLDTEMSEVSRLEDSLELEETENDLETEISTVEEGKVEVMDLEIQLPRPRDQPDMEKQKLQEELEDSQVYGSKMEHLWKEAMEKTVWLQNQLLDKDSLLEEEKKRGNEMEASLRNLKAELDNRDLQIETFLNMERKLIGEKEELEEKLSVAFNHGKELDSLLQEVDEKARKIANDFEEEVQKRENKIRDLLGHEEKLRGEKLVLEDKLENTVNLLMKERMEKERENSHWHQKLQEKDQELETLRKEEECRHEQRREMEKKLRNLSRERNSLLRAVEKQSKEYQLLTDEKEREKTEMRMDYQETLKQKDSEIEKLREGEEELLQLRKDCQKLKENLRIQEENMIREQRRLRERQTRLEEALRDQDKYMLMTLLHGTAQRNFHLQQTALQHGNEILDSSEKERQEEDLQMRKEKQHRKYCDTQRERTNYGNQWEVLTHTLTDIVQGDERTPEATTGNSNKNSEIFNENLADKTCLQSNVDEKCKVEPLRAETHE